MKKKILKNIKGKTGRKIVKLFLFNLAFTLFMFYLVLKKKSLEDFFDVFIISLITALCSYTFTKIATDFIEKKSGRQKIYSTTSWMLSGALTGSILSCLFFYFSQKPDFMGIVRTVFLYSFLFALIFEVGLLYYFQSRIKIEEFQHRIQDERIKRLTLEKEAAIATMKLMQAQIEPHFLFNTLSNIDSFFEIDLAKARKMLQDLNEYLRIALQRTRENMITLDQELAFVARYLDILKVRMGKRLTFEIRKKGDCSQIPFPPMLLQPLVENAVKYGLEPKKDGGHICIVCSSEQNQLRLSVTDTGMGIHKISDTKGIGLNNITQRLDAVYGDRATLIIKENKPSGVKAIIEVSL